MRRNKPGLADLKKLTLKDQPPDAPSPSAQPRSQARKRSPFLPPSAAPSVGPGNAAVPAAVSPRARKKGKATSVPPPAQPTVGANPAVQQEAVRISETDRQLFRNAVRYVEKIRDPGRVLLSPARLAPDSILEERRKRAAGLDADKPAQRHVSPKEEVTAPRGGQKRSRPLSDAYVPATHAENDTRYLKAGHGTDVLRDLKRGKWPVGASLDLHGSNLEDARERFQRFLDSCLTHDIKCVRIVHGKGYGSPNGDAVLKSTVRRWLSQLNEVIAYVECQEADGGSGAVQVLLK